MCPLTNNYEYIKYEGKRQLEDSQSLRKITEDGEFQISEPDHE